MFLSWLHCALFWLLAELVTAEQKYLPIGDSPGIIMELLTGRNSV